MMAASRAGDLPTGILLQAKRADASLRPAVRETPLLEASWLGRERGTNVLLKMESLQVTGSFKFRGAMAKILTLAVADRPRAVVAASTGNHGAAVAEAGFVLKIPVRVFVPESVSPIKLSRIVTRGAEVTQIPGDPVNAERTARAYAVEHGLPYVSPYNDPSVVAGQATVGLELLRQCGTQPAAIFVPLGGGGLSTGIAISVKAEWPSTQVIACSPANSPVMIRSIQAGRLVDLPSLPTISDGTAGGIEQGAITFDLCRAWIDEFLTVSEEEIVESMVQVIENERLLLEGSAAVAVAGFRKVAHRYVSECVVVVLSGANVSRGTLRRVLPGSSHQPGIN
jgi:threonine dehydratase